MPASDYGFYLHAVEKTAAQPVITPGGSGYFSAPRKDFDPRLFVGDQFRPDVRQFILDTLYTFWDHRFKGAKSWSTVWAAGSGISYQWKSDRSNGDLDILIGVDFPKFFAANAEYAGIPEQDMADIFNKAFHADLWPQTADWNGFEVTFYVNPHSTDIRDINPYAAYDITHNTWTVRPPVLPEDPSTLYPKVFRQAVAAERERTASLVARHATLKREVEAANPGSPGWTNSVTQLNLVVGQARDLFQSIHLDRKQAFGEGGKGYGDYYNYRWQAHKQAGTVQALAALSQVDKDAHAAQETDLYGRALETASTALSGASLLHSGGRR